MHNTETDETVRRLLEAFANRRLRAEAELIPVKELAAAARLLGENANMKMGRPLLVGAIERVLLTMPEVTAAASVQQDVPDQPTGRFHP
jgi:hypothetical protein